MRSRGYRTLLVCSSKTILQWDVSSFFNVVRKLTLIISLYTDGENAKKDKRTENLETIINLRNRTGEKRRRLNPALQA